jgi:Asp-tRNA(Asn)/Glu-tRNA(Gln) amidotransferase C subunit
MDVKIIKKQAKEIMDNFASALEKVKVEESRVEREEDRRKEGNGEEADSDFRKIMLENAPEKDEDCIKAEKGGWLE